jgi:plastocyanin
MGFSRFISLALAASTVACGGYSPTSPTGGGQMATPPPPGTVAVNIQDFSFSPAAVSVKVGTTVQWTNRGPSAHTTTSDGGVWNSGNLAGPTSTGGYAGGASPGGTFSFKFTTAGTFPYHCSLHPPSVYPGFTGTVTVTP